MDEIVHLFEVWNFNCFSLLYFNAVGIPMVFLPFADHPSKKGSTLHLPGASGNHCTPNICHNKTLHFQLFCIACTQKAGKHWEFKWFHS